MIFKLSRKKMGYSKESAIVTMLLILLTCCLASMTTQQGVRLLWRGVQYPNSSTVRIEDVGEGSHALACQTDRRPCCGMPPYRYGEWYYPNGSRVPIEGAGRSFYRNRNDEGLVLLHRRYHSLYPTGIYCCVLPDANGVNQKLCVGLFPIGNISGSSIVGASYNATSFTFSCITSAGIATYMNEDECGNTQQLVSFSQQVLDRSTSRYNNELRWGSQSQGSYICSTRNRDSISYAVLLTEFGIDQGSCSSQIVGTLGQELTLLCLGNEPVTGAVWMTPDGMRASSNITFARLSTSNAGVYTCHGTIQGRIVSSVIDLRISNCSGLVYVKGIPATILNITQSYNLSCDTFYWETGCIEEEYYLYHGDELISRFMFRIDSVSDILSNHFFCTVTVNGTNFTSNPAYYAPKLILLPSPLSVSISSDTDNPIPYGSPPTLSCTVSLSPAVDIEIEIVTEWSGPTYGLREYTTTEPVMNSSAEVPTYTSTARLDVPETFYDSGDYYCSVVINPLNNQDFIRSAPAMASPRIPVLYLYPGRPRQVNIPQVGFNWILISWNLNPSSDNVSNYEVQYSYVGECDIMWRGSTIWTAGGTNSYNITDLGANLNYNITLIAVNDTGRSPPYTDFARTRSMAPTGGPQAFAATLKFSTNITVQWQRVICSERNSEITHYLLQYSLAGSNNIIKEEEILGTDNSNRMYTANRLKPLSEYTFTIAAVNSGGQRGPNTVITATTSAPESVVFQLQLSGVHSCLHWRISDPEDKVRDVIVGIASGVNQQCPRCELEHTNITDGEFQCFPGSPNQVTFRAKVHDRAQATAREVITHIEQWISSSDVVTLPVHHARLKINSTCVVLLASFDDPECSDYLLPPFQPTTSITSDKMTSYFASDKMTSDSISKITPTAQLTMGGSKGGTLPPVVTKLTESDTGAIVGGAVAIALIIMTGAVMMVLMFLLYSVFKLKRHTQPVNPRTLKKLDESPHKNTVPVKAAAQGTESQDEIYEMVEMQVTSSAKARYAPAQMPQESSAKTRHVETEAGKDYNAGKGDDLEAYEIMNAVRLRY